MNIHLFSLTEDTFFLALEDIHSRVRGLQNLHNQENAKKVKFFTYSTPEEFAQKQKQYSTDKQIRHGKRIENKLYKILKKQSYLAPGNKTKEDKANAYKNRKNNIKKSIIGMINNGNLGASYDPTNRTVGINRILIKKNPYTGTHTTALERHKLLSHELEHKNQFDNIKSRYGNSGLNQAISKGSLGTAFASGEPVYYYTHNPIEKKAFEIGANTNSLRDRNFGKYSKEGYDKLAKSMVNSKLFHKAQKHSKIDQATITKNFKDNSHKSMYERFLERHLNKK